MSVRTQRCFSESAAPRSTFRTRISSFIAGVTVSGGVGAYLFYFNFNDVADQINEGITELGVKFKKDTTRLNKEVKELKTRIASLEGRLSSDNE